MIWTAAHLYYSNSLDEFLIKSVLPCVNELNRLKSFDKFFFIRYFDRGKHIRLRFYSDDKKIDEIINPFIRNYFEDFFSKYPSIKSESEWVNNLSEDKKWFPDNSIQFIQYEPEYERYGGPTGMEISEEHFHICSDCVLKVISESKEWTYEKSMGVAIQLMVSFCISVGMNTDEMIDFFIYYCNMSIQSSITYYYKIKNEKDVPKYTHRMIDVFKERFKDNKEMYSSILSQIITSIVDEAEFEEEWFVNWIKQNRNISDRLTDSLSKNALILPESFIRQETNLRKLFYLYFSYMHMTFNRLGIENKDESYLCYLIAESLKSQK